MLIFIGHGLIFLFLPFSCVSQGMDAFNQSKIVELLKDGNRAEQRPSRDGTPSARKCENETESEEGVAEWSGVRKNKNWTHPKLQNMPLK